MTSLPAGTRILPVALVALSALGGCSGNASTEGSAASADTASPAWCHDTMRSTNGTNIAFDYQALTSEQGQDIYVTASPAWLNVSNDSFYGTENVTIVVLDFTYEQGDGEDTPNLLGSQSLPMTWNGTNFTVQVTSNLGMYHLTNGDDVFTSHEYQFAVVVNNDWIKDPISGGSNFTYDPSTQGSSQDSCDGLPNWSQLGE